MIGLREDEDPENCPFIKDSKFPKAQLSELPPVHVFFFSIHILLYSLPSASSPKFVLD